MPFSPEKLLRELDQPPTECWREPKCGRAYSRRVMNLEELLETLAAYSRVDAQQAVTA